MIESIIGKNTVNFAKAWAKTGAIFGGAAGCGFLYLTDWKLILQYVPIYNTKFKTAEE